MRLEVEALSNAAFNTLLTDSCTISIATVSDLRLTAEQSFITASAYESNGVSVFVVDNFYNEL